MMRQRRSYSPSQNRAFTIIELLIAASITVVLIGLMLQILTAVLQSWNKTNGTLTTKSQMVTVMNYLTQDFDSIVWKRDSNVWLIASVQQDQTTSSGDAKITDADWTPAVPKPKIGNAGDAGSSLRLEMPTNTQVNHAADLGFPLLETFDLKDYRFGQAGVWLRFFTMDRETGAPTAVSYQIVRMKPEHSSNEYRYLLFRSTCRSMPSAGSSDSVLTMGYNLAMNDPGTNNDYNDNGASAGGDPEPSSIRKPDRAQILANNVVDFGVRFWKHEVNTTTGFKEEVLLFPAKWNSSRMEPSNDHLAYAETTLPATGAGSVSFPYTSGLPSSAFPSTAVTNHYGYPDMVDIFIRVLSDEGARKLDAFESGFVKKPADFIGTDSEYWWKLVEENSQVYTQRIPLREPALN